MGMPPPATASAANSASSAEETRTAGITPMSSIQPLTASLFTGETPSLPRSRLGLTADPNHALARPLQILQRPRLVSSSTPTDIACSRLLFPEAFPHERFSQSLRICAPTHGFGLLAVAGWLLRG